MPPTMLPLAATYGSFDADSSSSHTEVPIGASPPLLLTRRFWKGSGARFFVSAGLFIGMCCAVVLLVPALRKQRSSVQLSSKEVGTIMAKQVQFDEDAIMSAAVHRSADEVAKLDASIRYALIFDMGSTGSRVHIYRWLVAKPLRTLIELGTMKTGPGINFFAETTNNTNDIAARTGASLLPLLEFARTLVPPEQRGESIVIGGATAGVRHLPTQELRDATMKGVSDVLGASGFKVVYSGIIPGWQEGLFDWLAVNAALGLLAFPGTPTVGAVDLGGASSQIAYAIKPTEHTQAPLDGSRITVLERPGTFRIELATGLVADLYSVSRSHYGSKEAFEYVISADIDGEIAGIKGHLAGVPQPNEHNVYEHPCMPPGVYTKTKQGKLVRGNGDAKACHESIQHFYYQGHLNDLGNVTATLPEPVRDPRENLLYVAFDHIAYAQKLAGAVMKLKEFETGQIEGLTIEENDDLPLAPDTFGINFEMEDSKITNAKVRDEADEKLSRRAARNDERITEDSKEEKSEKMPRFGAADLRDCLDRWTIPDPDYLLAAADRLCPRHWAGAKLTLGGTLKSPHEGCFLLNYVAVLLRDVYNFKEGTHNVVGSFQLSRCPRFNEMDLRKQFPYTFGPENKPNHAKVEEAIQVEKTEAEYYAEGAVQVEEDLNAEQQADALFDEVLSARRQKDNGLQLKAKGHELLTLSATYDSSWALGAIVFFLHEPVVSGAQNGTLPSHNAPNHSNPINGTGKHKKN